MKSKSQVYVKVDSKKVAKKLKKVLDMFGENTLDNEVIQDALRAGGNVHFWNKLSWAWGHSSDKTKVTVSELKQILFREHAKKGDVVIVDNGEGGSRWILELTGNDIEHFEHSNSFDLKTGENDFCKFGNSIAGGKFIRYATEEEKSLLNPKKQLEVGKWYWGKCEKLIFVSGLNGDGDLARGYGIGANGNWYDDDGSFSWLTNDLRESTKEEVEQSLIKEAEKRYKIGDVVKYLDRTDNDDELLGYTFVFNNNKLYAAGRCDELFNNGKWAEVIEQEKTLEQRVKELEDFIYGHKDFIAHITNSPRN